MGVTTTDNDEQQAGGEMTTAKPKERQFQVVPVPGTFTRGRWKCWDYKDNVSESDKIINFTEKLPASINITENAAGYIASCAEIKAESIKNTLSEPRMMPSADINSAAMGLSNAQKGSNTIVTSGVQPSVTPARVVPSSANISSMTTNTAMTGNKGKSISVVSGGSDYNSCREKSSLTDSAAVFSKTPAAVSGSSTVGSAIPHTTQIYVTTSASNPSIQPVVSDPNLMRQPMQPSFASEAVLTKPSEPEDQTATSAAATGANVVAIDNKIEQAMDLVKTHLTFAVREEVEILRSTIVELEAKVAQLESQNQVLKQFAPLEVVNSLAVLVQQHQQRLLQQQQQQQQLHSATATSNPAQPVQNAPLAAQSQHQSMPVLATEVSAPPTSLPSSASIGMQTEVQHVTEQKQQKSIVPGTMAESEKKQ